MIKTLSLLRRKPEMTREEFQRWWLEEHVLLGKKIPGIRKYVVSFTIGSTTHEDDPPFDGIAELWWDDREALQHGWFESPEGRAAIADSYANVSDRLVLIVEEHQIL